MSCCMVWKTLWFSNDGSIFTGRKTQHLSVRLIYGSGATDTEWMADCLQRIDYEITNVKQSSFATVCHLFSIYYHFVANSARRKIGFIMQPVNENHFNLPQLQDKLLVLIY